MDCPNCKNVIPGGVPFQVAQLNGDGGLDSRFRGNDGLSAAIPPKLERYPPGAARFCACCGAAATPAVPVHRLRLPVLRVPVLPGSGCSSPKEAQL